MNRLGPVRVGSYGICLDDLERVGVQSLRRVVASSQIAEVVIDELGPIAEMIQGTIINRQELPDLVFC